MDAHLTVELAGGGLGYVEPIRIKPPCLACHGASLAPATADELAERYPEDQATGYKLGELRGLFWAEVHSGPELSGSR